MELIGTQHPSDPRREVHVVIIFGGRWRSKESPINLQRKCVELYNNVYIFAKTFLGARRNLQTGGRDRWEINEVIIGPFEGPCGTVCSQLC